MVFRIFHRSETQQLFNQPRWIIADKAHVNDLASLSGTDRRLAAYGGSSFEPILQAFHQEDFIALVHQSLDNWKATKNQYKSAMLIKQSKIILAFWTPTC